MERLLSAETTTHEWGFPARKDELEELFQEACEPQYQYDENGEIKLCKTFIQRE